MIPNVYLHDHICDSAVARLRRHVNLVDNFDHPEELDAIIVRQQYCPREVINRAKRCRLIQMHGVGLDRIDVEAARRRTGSRSSGRRAAMRSRSLNWPSASCSRWRAR